VYQQFVGKQEQHLQTVCTHCQSSSAAILRAFWSGVALMEDFDVNTRPAPGTSAMQRAEINLDELGAHSFFEQSVWRINVMNDTNWNHNPLTSSQRVYTGCLGRLPLSVWVNNQRRGLSGDTFLRCLYAHIVPTRMTFRHRKVETLDLSHELQSPRRFK